MRNIDELVRKSSYTWPHTFEEQREFYDELTKEIEILLKEKEKYDEWKNEDNSLEAANNFRNALDLYRLAKRPDQQNKALSAHLLEQYPELKAYTELCDSIRERREVRRDILTEYIYFDNFAAESTVDVSCFPKHCFVKIDDDLVCMQCGASTRDFTMSKEDIEFLELCAESQGMFLKEVSKNDMPLLKILLEEKKERERTRIPIYEIEETSIMGHMDWEEEYYLEDESAIPDIRRKIIQAKMLDAGIFETDNYRVGNPKYFKPEKTERLLKSINEQLLLLENTSSVTRDLQLEICRTYRYEVLILSGNRIPIMYDEAKSEEEKIALIKAYSNISNQNYRIHSGYFNPKHRDNDAKFYTCRTAHPEINTKLPKMKLRR